MDLDPKKRYDCAQSLAHPWIASGRAREVNIHESVSAQMRKSAARMKWKKATLVAAAINKMKISSRSEDDTDTVQQNTASAVP
jgi:uncharacterized protein (DUF952 family)